MSIYATLGAIQIAGDGWPVEADWSEVYFQGVPGHIGHPAHYDCDPYADFLPPPVEDEEALRAVVVLLADDDEKEIQRYVRPLMTLTGREWAGTSFADLLRRIEDAVRERRHRRSDAGEPEPAAPREGREAPR